MAQPVLVGRSYGGRIVLELANALVGQHAVHKIVRRDLFH